MRYFVLGSLAVVSFLAISSTKTLAQPQGKRQFYEETWTLDRDKGYYSKRYYFKEDAGNAAYKFHVIIYKPQRSKDYVYWFNPYTGKYWARCATKNHPEFGKQVKEFKDFWSMLPNEKKRDGLDDINEKDFGALKQISPPIPGSKDNIPVDCPPIDLPKS